VNAAVGKTDREAARERAATRHANSVIARLIVDAA
jgi:hypothetical protein